MTGLAFVYVLGLAICVVVGGVGWVAAGKADALRRAERERRHEAEGLSETIAVLDNLRENLRRAAPEGWTAVMAARRPSAEDIATAIAEREREAILRALRSGQFERIVSTAELERLQAEGEQDAKSSQTATGVSGKTKGSI